MFEFRKNGLMTSTEEAASAAPPFTVSREGHVATLTISNPRRKNSIGQAAWTALRDAVSDVAVGDARVLVITGDGDDFCAGADLSARGERHALIGMQEVNEACLALHRVRVPVICRVDGYAVGAGMNLALAGDFVIASDRARFAQIFVKRGLSVDFGGSWLLPRLVGLHRAKEMVLLGEMIDAATLHGLGIVREVVPPGELDDAVARLAAQLVDGPPVALAQSKRLLNDAFESSLEGALEAEARAQAVNLAMEDAAEAGRAFFEKRPAVFRGR
jgi:2-(1,2-epoxy-1,2-dihydrophenyl)acetyl-CoA isomerase